MVALDAPRTTADLHAEFPSPLIDNELVDRRARHRRAVRRIPSWIVTDITTRANLTAVATLRDHPDNILMEMHLRDLADRLLGQLRLALELLSDESLVDAAHQLYAVVGDAQLELLALERERIDIQRDVTSNDPSRRDARKLEDVDYGTIAALITAVSWADDLAGDYRDPRIDL
jgi:hypothetical protein